MLSRYAVDVSILTAALDLKLVQLLRAAMNGGRVTGLGPAATYTGGRPAHGFIDGDRQYAGTIDRPEIPRSADQRDSVHLSSQVCPDRVPHCDRAFEAPILPPPIICEREASSSDVLPPPWKQVPIDIPAPVVLKIKIVKHEVDIINKGSLLDFFC